MKIPFLLACILWGVCGAVAAGVSCTAAQKQDARDVANVVLPISKVVCITVHAFDPPAWVEKACDIRDAAERAIIPLIQKEAIAAGAHR